MDLHDEHGAIKILRDGTWLHGGAPIRRENMVRLFAGILRRDGQGLFWLETPYEREPVEVEDAPFLGVELRADAPDAFSIRTNVGDWVALGPGHGLRVAETEAGPAPYLHVRGGLEARLTRAVYYELVDLSRPGDGGLRGVKSRGVFYPVEPS